MESKQGLLERLKNGETVICAQGYKSELDRRGLVRLDDVTTQAVLEFPNQVRELHEQFVHCGSDVIVSCNTHDPCVSRYGNRPEESSFRQSMKIARAVGDKRGALVAGTLNATGISYENTTIKQMEKSFVTQIKTAVKEGADFILGEMFTDTREAKLALECIQKHGDGITSVMTMLVGSQEKTTDAVSIPQALRALEKMGADVVGLACGRGPATLMPLMREVRKICKGPIAAIPVAYRTSVGQESMQLLKDRISGEPLYPLDLDSSICNRIDVQKFAEEAKSLGIQVVGLCCGAYPSFFREIAEVYGKETPSSSFGLNLSGCSLFRPNPNPHRIKIRKFQLTHEYAKLLQSKSLSKE